MFTIGTVVASYPQGHSVDVLLDHDGRRLANVQVLTSSASGSTGVIDLPDIGGPSDDTRWSPTVERGRYVKAIVAFFVGTVPFVVGFLFPQVNQLTFQEKNRRIQRHASDVYTTIDNDGNVELYHPNGTYLRIGTAAEHEDLTAKDFDKKWAITKNTSKATHFQLTVKNAGTLKASLNIDPSGNITLNHVGNLVINTDGNATIGVDGNAAVTVGGTTAVTSAGAATITAPTVTIDADTTTVTGLLEVEGGMNITGGDATMTGGDITADGISLKTHTHSGVDTGAGNTGVPNP